MGDKVNTGSLIENNTYLKNAFYDCRNISSSNSEPTSLFSTEKKYKVNDNSSVVIDGNKMSDCYKFLYGYDFRDMAKEGNLTTFNYDKNNDGNYEVSYTTSEKKNETYVSIDDDSNGVSEKRYTYKDGVLRSVQTFSEDGKQVVSYVTYDENGNQCGLGEQITNEFSVLLINWLIGKVDGLTNK